MKHACSVARLALASAMAIVILQATSAGDVSAADGLTLAGARELAVVNSKTLAKYRLATDSAVIDERIQFYDSLPSLTLSATGKASAPTSAGQTVTDTVSAGLTVGVSQTVWDGGKNSVLASIDSIATGIAREAARAEYFSVLDSVDSAWYSLLEARASLEAADAAIAVSDLSLEIAKVKLEAGAIPMSDYLEAEANAESGRATRSQASRDVSVYSAKVASLVGLRKLPAIAEESESASAALVARLSALSDSDADALIEKLLTAVMAGNPSLAKASLERIKAGRSVDLARAGYGPAVSASASGGMSYAASDNSLSPSLSLSVSASLPLDPWKTAADVDSARIAERQASLDCEESGRTIDIDLRTAVYGCVSQARSVLSSAKALDYAKKLYERKFESYKLSSASVSDLSDAASLVSANSKALISARYDFLSGLSTIRSLAALETDDEVRNLMQ